MATSTVNVCLPEELVAEIDKVVGAEGRAMFLANVARDAIRRLKLAEFLKSEQPVWRDEDHPELAAMGTNTYVRNLRIEWESRAVPRVTDEQGE